MFNKIVFNFNSKIFSRKIFSINYLKFLLFVNILIILLMKLDKIRKKNNNIEKLYKIL